MTGRGDTKGVSDCKIAGEDIFRISGLGVASWGVGTGDGVAASDVVVGEEAGLRGGAVKAGRF